MRKIDGPVWGRKLVCGVAGVLVGVVALGGCRKGSDATVEGLIGDPDAALEFLYPDGVVEPGSSPVAVEYIRDTDWNSEGFDSLAVMLDEAATAYRDPDNPKSELSALAATDTINLLGERNQIADTAYDSLGHLLGNYIIDVDRTVNDGVSPTVEELGPRFAGLPPGAEFDSGALNKVMSETLESPGAVAEVTNAALQLNANRIDAVIEAGADVEVMTAVAFESDDLLNYVMDRGGLRNKTERDATSDAMIGEIDNALNLRPKPDTRFVEFLQGQDITRSDNSPTLLPNPEDILDDPAQLTETSSGSYYPTGVLVGIELGDAGLLDVSESTDSPNYPWFEPVDDGPQANGYQFNPATALQPENRARFEAALLSDGVWGSMFNDLANNR